MLHLYVSVSGPHLGFMYSTNSVLDTGISVLKSVSGKGGWLGWEEGLRQGDAG